VRARARVVSARLRFSWVSLSTALEASSSRSLSSTIRTYTCTHTHTVRIRSVVICRVERPFPSRDLSLADLRPERADHPRFVAIRTSIGRRTLRRRTLARRIGIRTGDVVSRWPKSCSIPRHRRRCATRRLDLPRLTDRDDPYHSSPCHQSALLKGRGAPGLDHPRNSNS